MEKPAYVVEMMGLAGTGKTTLSHILSQRKKTVRVGIPLQKISYLPSYLSTAYLLLPAYFPRNRADRRFTWGEIRAMVYLKAWHHALERRTPNNGTITILDHGPIYRLALLHEFGPEFVRSQLFSNWWCRMLKQWAATLDMIIWLDAPDAVLLERIHTRNRWHAVKDIPEQQGYEFLTRYRMAFEQTISMLMADNGPKIIRLETYKEPVSQTADRILATLKAELL